MIYIVFVLVVEILAVVVHAAVSSFERGRTGMDDGVVLMILVVVN
jgi:hypothetical protein